MDNMLNLFIGTLCFSLPILLAAFLGIKSRLKTLALVKQIREEGRSVSVDPIIPKRLRLIGLVDFILCVGLGLCLLIIINKPPEPILYILVGIAAILIITIIVMQFVFHKTEIKIFEDK